LARKILLADDSVTAQNMGRKILSDAGYEVITVNNGSAALKKIAEQKPDLIVLDVYMPGYSGLEVCQRLKEARETARIPVMLTVGKLEPFKPEEAKRVRAEGFIVKPFEASELLSALSKLEDKIVPRSEASKTGRFGRALAAIEEADQAREDDDSGWKKRIAFPSKKKREESREAEDDSVISRVESHSAVNAKSAHSEQERASKAVEPEGRRDVGAIAPPGLPKDVTAEEIAAIAAAAAQVQAAMAAAKDTPADSQARQFPSEESAIASSAIGSQQPSEVSEPSRPAEQAVAETASVPEQSTTSVPVAAFATIDETHGSQRSTEPATAVSDGKEESPLAESVPTAPVVSDCIPASADSEAGTEHRSRQTAEIPTMAAAGALNSGDGRWTAVPVAVSAEEEAIPLELEMQKAHAALAAAEANYPGFVSSIPNSSFSESPWSTPSSPTGESEAAAPTAITAAPVAAEPLGEVAALAANDARAQSSYEPVAQANNTPDQTGTEISHSEPETGQHGEPTGVAVEAVEEHSSVPVSAESTHPEPDGDTVRAEAISDSAPAGSDSQTGVAEPQAVAVPAPAVPELSVMPSDSAADEGRETAGLSEPGPAGSTSSSSEAWQHSADLNEPAQPAAMAAAAGAEKSPEDLSASAESDSGEIASIVDSVLADLRPKIVAEISKKLGKKR